MHTTARRKLSSVGGFAARHLFNAYPDPSFHFIVDPDPTFHFNAAPDPVPHQSDANLRQLFYISYKALLWASTTPKRLHFEALKFKSSDLFKMRIWIQIFTLLRIWIHLPKMMRIHAKPHSGLQHCSAVCFYYKCLLHFRSNIFSKCDYFKVRQSCQHAALIALYGRIIVFTRWHKLNCRILGRMEAR